MGEVQAALTSDEKLSTYRWHGLIDGHPSARLYGYFRGTEPSWSAADDGNVGVLFQRSGIIKGVVLDFSFLNRLRGVVISAWRSAAWIGPYGKVRCLLL